MHNQKRCEEASLLSKEEWEVSSKRKACGGFKLAEFEETIMETFSKAEDNIGNWFP